MDLWVFVEDVVQWDVVNVLVGYGSLVQVMIFIPFSGS